MQPPGIRGKGWVIERLVCGCDVLELDELIPGIIVTESIASNIGRVGINLSDYDWPDQRSGIGCAQRACALQHKLFFPSANHMPSESAAGWRCAKGKPVRIPGEVCAVAGEEPNVITLGP